MQRTGIMVVEDRDLAYLFLDPTGIEEAAGGHPVTIAIDDNVMDWEDEENAVWLEKEDNHCSLRVVTRDLVWGNGGVDFDKHGFPIPTPVIIVNKAAWERHQNE